MYHNHGMKLAFSRLAMVALSVVFLAACGGSGSPGSGGATLPPNPPTVRIIADTTTVPANPLLQLPALSEPRTIQLTAQVRTTGGSVVADGTVVNITTNNASVGTVSIPDDPETDDVNEFTQFLVNVGTETSGGNATFFFTSGESAGTARLTVSTTDPGTGNAITSFIDITVTPVEEPDQLNVTPSEVDLPANPDQFPPTVGSPFLAEVSFELLGSNGAPINPLDGVFAVNISPVGTATFSTLDDPSTDDVDEFQQTLGQGLVPAVGGQGRVFVNSGTQPGVAQLTISATDPQTSRQFSKSVAINVAAGTPSQQSIQLSASKSTLPANSSSLPPALGSPFLSEVNIELIGAEGQVINPVDDVFAVNIAPSSSATFSTLDDPGADDDEFLVALSQAQVNAVDGRATVFVNSGIEQGLVTLNVSAVNPVNNNPVTGSIQITITDAVPPDEQITIDATATEVPANPLLLLPALSEARTIQLNAQVRGIGGNLVPNGTVVDITTDNASIGTVSIPDDPETGDVNEFTQFLTNASVATVGGNATFFFTSGETPGTVRLTLSTSDPVTGNAVTAFIDITVTPVDPAEQVTITATQDSLPVNTAGVEPFIGSPFLSEVTIDFIGMDGVPVNPVDDNFGVSIAPVGTASFSTLDDPETEDVNEFLLSLGQGPVNAVGGQGIVFINAGSQPGTATLTITGADPVSGQNFSVSKEFTVAGGASDGIPAAVSLQVPAQPVFVQGVGSSNTVLVSAQVTDAGGQLVSAPAEINNVIVELQPPNPNNSRLQAVDAAGSTVSGNEIAIASVNGLARFSFISGSTGGVHQLSIVADGADNNVDNGIQQPVTGSSSISVGNGQLAAIELVSPLVNAININRVSDVVDPDEDLDVDPETGLVIPPDPDGTYSLPYTIVATDPFGVPVPAGTVINFGKIDAPLSNFAGGDVFTFSGLDGDPQEGNNQFNVPLTQPPDFDGFADDPTAIDEAVQNNDTLLLFGKSVPGNDELESARFVDQIFDDFSILLQSSLNDNNGSGVIVDDGPVIPYIIGRSNTGNITGQAQSEANGTANVVLTYPINELGRPVAIWAQGTRPDGDSVQTVADVISARFPGVAPAVLAVSPNTIGANTSRTVQVCLRDALNAPISNVALGVRSNTDFAFSTDPVNPVTGADGCVLVTITTTDIATDDIERIIEFVSGSATAQVRVIAPSLAFISASPSALALLFNTRDVTVTVINSNGDPAVGLQVQAVCQSPVTVGSGNVTDENGEAVFRLALSAIPDEQTSVTCDFSASVGNQTLTTNVLIFIDP